MPKIPKIPKIIVSTLSAAILSGFSGLAMIPARLAAQGTSASTATSFAMAAVVDERYGWKGGVPAYLAAGLIGFSEIDQQRHTVSDVVFGAALGYVIGKSIAASRYRPDSPFKLVPFIDTYTGSQGIAFERRY